MVGVVSRVRGEISLKATGATCPYGTFYDGDACQSTLSDGSQSTDTLDVTDVLEVSGSNSTSVNVTVHGKETAFYVISVASLWPVVYSNLSVSIVCIVKE